MSSLKIDDLWDFFYHGDRHALETLRCPKCGGTLQWSPHISSESRLFLGKMRHQMGLSVYCLGACNYMLLHLDGMAPEWALSVKDWDAFNRELRPESMS